MKKSILIAMITTIGIVSACKKITVEPPLPPPPPTSEERTIASDWYTMGFTVVNNNDGTTVLQASRTIDNIAGIDLNSHFLFAYAKVRAADSYEFRQLPMTIETQDGNLVLDFWLDASNFSIQIMNVDDPSKEINAQQFDNYEFRLILVSAQDFHRLQVDWNNYLEVVSALEI